MLRENIEKIFKNYLNSRNENFANHPIAATLRKDLTKDLKGLTENSEEYKFTGSAGLGKWTNSPWVAAFNKKITESAQSGYYIVYLFREDMEGVYLSLNQGMTDIKNQTSNSETKEILRSRASDFRHKLQGKLSDEFLEEIDLHVINSPNAPFYEAGNIFAKYYSADDLPSEDILEDDYKEILRLYELLVGENPILKVIEDAQEIKAAQDKFLDILYRNSDEIIPISQVKIGMANETEIKTYWSNELGFWVVNRQLDIGNRYFNAFGIEKPDDTHAVSAVCEINIEKEGIKRKTSGAFAKDTEGNVYLIHRGSLSGISKNDFLDQYNGISEIVQDGDIQSRAIVIGTLADPKLPELVKNFILEVIRIKGDPKQLRVIEDINQIKEAQNRFINTLTIYLTKTVNGKAGFQGGQEAGEVYWSDLLGIWLMTRKIENSRYWNGFGIKEPSEGAGLTITTEINFPIQGIDRRIAGAFVTDGNQIYLAHRGKLGGNFSKKFFDENYTGNWTTVQDGNQQTEIVLIASLDDEKLPEKVSQFVFEVERMKTGKTRPINIQKQSFHEYLKSLGYLFSPDIIENFLLSLKIKPFVILTGNSGTGKTKLAQLFAQYKSIPDENLEWNIQTEVKVGKSSKSGGWTLSRSEFYKFYPELKNLEHDYKVKIDGIQSKGNLSVWPQLFYDNSNEEVKDRLKELEKEDPKQKVNLEISLPSSQSDQYKIVPVGANWTENRHLLGFFNVIQKQYQDTASLELILNSKNDQSSPHFLILDEMNLSHVERYFADFLSAMESGESIPLYKKTTEEDEIPTDLVIPKNLFVIGTVNVDETTYMFSPKVLDRANTIEFSTYPAKDYMNNNQHDKSPEGNLEYLENPLSDLETRIFTVEDLKEHLKDVKINSNDYLWDVLANEIQAFQEVLGKAGFDFGFRVINEILRFMYVAWVYEGKQEVWSNWMRYFDAQVNQKMLPKLHGSQRVLEEVLKDLFDLCYIDTIDSPPRSFEDLKSVPTVKYLESAQKIQEMDKVLNEQRYVSFIN
ncbi:MAG: MrcB family domain-containing protein [Methanobacterium formicicum]